MRKTVRDFAGGKIIVKCECGMRKRYDGRKMLDAAGDIPMPDLLVRIARALGCEKAKPKASIYDRCKLIYDNDAMAAYYAEKGKRK